MKRGRSTGTPTKAQQARHDCIREIGCIVAHMRGLGHVPCAVHHLTVGGKHGAKRRGHDFVIGLNDWSHQGYPVMGWTKEECLERLGPSYARQPRLFRETFGRDDVLLAYQNELIEQHMRMIA